MFGGALLQACEYLLAIFSCPRLPQVHFMVRPYVMIRCEEVKVCEQNLAYDSFWGMMLGKKLLGRPHEGDITCGMSHSACHGALMKYH